MVETETGGKDSIQGKEAGISRSADVLDANSDGAEGTQGNAVAIATSPSQGSNMRRTVVFRQEAKNDVGIGNFRRPKDSNRQ